MKASEPPVIVSENFSVSKEVLWDVITNLNHMKQWFFEVIPDFKPEVGFSTQFEVGPSEDRQFLHLWKIVEVIPYQKIVYNWKYEKYPGDSYVTFTITSNNPDTTTLTLETTVLEDFPDDVPEFKRESCVEGWNYFIKERLVTYVNSL